MFEYIKQKQNEFPRFFEILRFLISGTIATLIDMLVMGFLIYLPNKELFSENFMNVFYYAGIGSTLNVVLATGIGFLVGLAINYLLSVSFVFNVNKLKAKSKKSIIQFFIFALIGLFIQTFGMYIGYNLLKLNEWLIKIVLIIIVLTFNYLTRKFFVFNQNTKISIDKNKIEKNNEENKEKHSVFYNIIQILINVLFIFSCLCLFYSLFNKYTGKIPLNNINNILEKIYIFLIAGFLFLFLFIIDKGFLLKFIKKPRKPYVYILSTIITFSIIYAIVAFSPNNGLLYDISNIMSLFAVFFFSIVGVSLVFNGLITFLKSLSKIERISLFSIIIIGCISGLIVQNLTTVFTTPNKPDILLSFDTINYSNGKYAMNCFNPENDARHILMSFCMLPFYVIPYFISTIINFNYICAIISQLTQIVLISISIILLLRLFNLKNNLTYILLTLMLCLSSTIIINAITVEKFVISFFYIVLTLYFSINNNNFKWLTFALSVGMLSTNVLLLPIVLFCGKENFSDKLHQFLITLVLFVFAILVLGQSNLVLFFFDSLQHVLFHFSSTSHSILLTEKLKQLITFNANLFFIPKIGVNEIGNICQTAPSINYLFCFGLLICILWILGFIFNHKDKFSIICFYWNLTMIFMLVVVGYGTLNNEMFIYTLIYLWSTLYLVFKFFDKIIKNKQLFNSLLIIAVVCLMVHNSYTFFNIIKIAKIHYPAINIFK